MPLKLNNVEISNSITSFNKKQREVLEFTFTDGISPIDNVYLKIIKMPVSINNPTFNKKWDNGTNDGVTIDTTTDTELHLILEGTYNIEVTETYVSGVVRKRMVIIEAISLNNNLGIPFPGESLETNSADGWARKVEKSIQELSQNGSAVSVIGQHNTIQYIKTDVVCISDVIDTDNSGFFYEISTPGELIGVPVKQLGIVIDRWETGSAETFDPEIIYKVAFSGSFYVGSGFFHVGGVYYNETTNQLTNDPSDTPVGYYINNILYIEFPISIGTVHNDMLGRDASNAHPANTIELDDTGFTGFLSGKSIDEVEKLANEIDDAVGREDGIASLDGSGKLPVSQLPISVMEYKGVWDANTNNPYLENGGGTNGDVWVCTVAGTVDFGSGDIDFFEGDWAVYNGTHWEKSSHQGGSHSNTSHITNLVGEPGVITAMPDKTTLHNDDVVVIEDSEATGSPAKKVSIANLSESLNEGWRTKDIPLSSILILEKSDFGVSDVDDGHPNPFDLSLPHLFDNNTTPKRTGLFGSFNIWTSEVSPSALWSAVCGALYVNIDDDISDKSNVILDVMIQPATIGGTTIVDQFKLNTTVLGFDNTWAPVYNSANDTSDITFDGNEVRVSFQLDLSTIPTSMNMLYGVLTSKAHPVSSAYTLRILGARLRYKVKTSNVKESDLHTT